MLRRWCIREGTLGNKSAQQGRQCHAGRHTFQCVRKPSESGPLLPKRWQVLGICIAHRQHSNRRCEAFSFAGLNFHPTRILTLNRRMHSYGHICLRELVATCCWQWQSSMPSGGFVIQPEKQDWDIRARGSRNNFFRTETSVKPRPSRNICKLQRTAVVHTQRQILA